MASPRDFDAKFGREFIDTLPRTPGVYRIFDAGSQLIYIGKAKNLRRRLAQYRKPKRVKRHAKMRAVITDAARIEIETCPTELAALLLETQLIQAHRPKWNVAGAFYFLYPLVGWQRLPNGDVLLGYTTSPDEVAAACPGISFHGAFRSRQRTREAFFALSRLLEYIGHREIPSLALPKYTHVYRFRKLPEAGDWAGQWDAFFRGDSMQALKELSLALVEKPAARRDSGEVQDHLRAIARFWRHEVQLLRQTRDRIQEMAYPIPQKRRDALFLEARFRERAPEVQAP
ncbi:MAG: nucleotide excision repair endonuclease [Bacteriovoracia bacterium]